MQRNIRRPLERQARRGASAVEAAIVLSAVLLIVFGLFDLGLAVLQQNTLTECARRAARTAIVRGSRSSAPLGPSGWSGYASAVHPLTDSIRPHLGVMPPAAVTLNVSWPDADNAAGRAVVVQLQYQHQGVLKSLFGVAWTIRASSRMSIAH
ncbi:MAG: pilus assembly protein [Planctomyces sp.]|nr:pilus assembly protein [Planctomyces sp.]